MRYTDNQKLYVAMIHFLTKFKMESNDSSKFYWSRISNLPIGKVGWNNILQAKTQAATFGVVSAVIKKTEFEKRKDKKSFDTHLNTAIDTLRREIEVMRSCSKTAVSDQNKVTHLINAAGRELLLEKLTQFLKLSKPQKLNLA